MHLLRSWPLSAGAFGFDTVGRRMIDASSFWIYRIQVAWHLMDLVDDMGFKEAWKYSKEFEDFWIDEYDAFDAVLEELSNWTD